MAGTIETDCASSTEIHRVVYRIDTGAIVAIETVFTDEDGAANQPEALFRRLDAINHGFAARIGPLDVLAVQTMPIGTMRVDLATRTLVPVEQRMPESVAEPVDLYLRGVAQAERETPPGALA